jgi:hypothetical protein
VEVDRFDVGDTPHRALDRDSDGRPRAEPAVIADPERRVAESRLYRALVGRVYEAACDARTQALPELRDIRAGCVEVFDRIEATQRLGTDLLGTQGCGSQPCTQARKVYRRWWLVIIMRQVGALESVSVDFDEYVPLTITWSNASGVLETPSYVELRGENGYLEFKFHPSTGILIEVVLAAAPGVRVEQVNLSPRDSNDVNLMPFLDSGDAIHETESPLIIKAYPDYLYISFGPNPDQWVGSGPVLFGLAGEQSLTAICARWTGSERESVLAGHLHENESVRESLEDRNRWSSRMCRQRRPPRVHRLSGLLHLDVGVLTHSGPDGRLCWVPRQSAGPMPTGRVRRRTPYPLHMVILMP